MCAGECIGRMGILTRFARSLIGCFFSREASMMSMRRKIAGLTPEQIRQLATEEVDLPVSNKDFNEAISRCNKSVSRADLDKYEKWMKEFGSS